MRRYKFEVGGVVPRVVLVGQCLLSCPVCRRLRPLQLRVMANGEVRNQPRCGHCRKTKLGKKKRGASRKTPRRLQQLSLF